MKVRVSATFLTRALPQWGLGDDKCPPMIAAVDMMRENQGSVSLAAGDVSIGLSDFGRPGTLLRQVTAYLRSSIREL